MRCSNLVVALDLHLLLPGGLLDPLGAFSGFAPHHHFLIGLGPAIEVRTITICWPSGAVSTVGQLAADATYQIVEPQLPEAKQPSP